MNTTMYLSDHFSLAEATVSQEAERRGIQNWPSEDTLTIMRQTAMAMEVVRTVLGTPIIISSWFRNQELNALVGGTPYSQHIRGEAVDFIAPAFGTPLDICRKLIEYVDHIQFDQLILEHTWVHISFAISTCKPRMQVLSLLHSGHYASGLTDKQGNKL